MTNLWIVNPQEALLNRNYGCTRNYRPSATIPDTYRRAGNLRVHR